MKISYRYAGNFNNDKGLDCPLCGHEVVFYPDMHKCYCFNCKTEYRFDKSKSINEMLKLWNNRPKDTNDDT